MSDGTDAPEPHRRPDPDRIVLVHGFAQNSRCWGGLIGRLSGRFSPLAVDLPGHGRSTETALDLWDAADRVMSSIAAASERSENEPVTLLGYSMGARVCLHAALAHPTRVARLVLVSGTAGIDDDGERARRVVADRELAALIRTQGTSAFLDQWLAGPLMATLPADATHRSEREANSAEGLASSLESCGTGTQSPLWSRLADLAMPVLVVSGELDAKFTALGRRMAALAPNAEVVTIAGAGHSAHLEKPERFAAELIAWLGRTGSG